MLPFDRAIIDFFLKYIPHSYSFYKIVLFISDDNLLKGGVLAIVIWYLWFKTESLPHKRINIIATILSSFVTIGISRSITQMVPFQARPILNPSFSYFAFETDRSSIDQMSSFPSDHAALFIALATGLLFVSRKAGIFALIYTSVFILFPRIYLGYHYPSDIFAGALTGAVVSIVFNKSKYISSLISRGIIPFSKKSKEWFYPLFFLITFEIVVLFGDFRSLAMFIVHHKNMAAIYQFSAF